MKIIRKYVREVIRNFNGFQLWQILTIILQFFTKIAAALIRSGGLETKLARFITTQKIEINSIIIRLEIFDKKYGVLLIRLITTIFLTDLEIKFCRETRISVLVPRILGIRTGTQNPRDSRDRDKNLRDSPGTKITTFRDKNHGQSRYAGILCDASPVQSRCPGIQFQGESGTGI